MIPAGAPTRHPHHYNKTRLTGIFVSQELKEETGSREACFYFRPTVRSVCRDALPLDFGNGLVFGGVDIHEAEVGGFEFEHGAGKHHRGLERNYSALQQVSAGGMEGHGEELVEGGGRNKRVKNGRAWKEGHGEELVEGGPEIIG